MKKAPSMIVRTDGAQPRDGGQHPSAADLGRVVARALRPRVAHGLGFDLPAAVRAGQVRVVAQHTLDGAPLPSDWAIPVVAGEVVVACAPLGPPFSGVAALIVAMRALPSPKRDDAARERIARALAAALLADLNRRKR